MAKVGKNGLVRNEYNLTPDEVEELEKQANLQEMKPSLKQYVEFILRRQIRIGKEEREQVNSSNSGK